MRSNQNHIPNHVLWAGCNQSVGTSARFAPAFEIIWMAKKQLVENAKDPRVDGADMLEEAGSDYSPSQKDEKTVIMCKIRITGSDLFTFSTRRSELVATSP